MRVLLSVVGTRGDVQPVIALATDDNTRAWNERSRERVNSNRQRRGLAPLDDVLRHIVTERPWLATDPTLDPIPAR